MRLRDLLKQTKPVIAMVHLPPLPGSPLYDAGRGMERIVDSMLKDLEALQNGGVDAVMFGNEADRPYQIKVGPETVSAMASAIGQVKSQIRVPFGVDVLWDPVSAVAVANATGASFVREVMTNVYVGDLGFWNTNCGETLRFRKNIGADEIDLLFNVNAEFASPLDSRKMEDVVRSVVFSSLADIICVSGPMTGSSPQVEHIKTAKDAVSSKTSVLANTGVKAENVARILEVADGVVVGTSLKKDGVTWNPVDPARVEKFMEVVRNAR